MCTDMYNQTLNTRKINPKSVVANARKDARIASINGGNSMERRNEKRKQGKAALRQPKRSAHTRLLVVFVASFIILAAAIGPQVTTVSVVSTATSGTDKLNQTMSNILYFLIGISLGLAGIMIVILGTKWMTAQGHPDELAKVKQGLQGVAVGLVLCSISTVLVAIAKTLVVV